MKKIRGVRWQLDDIVRVSEFDSLRREIVKEGKKIDGWVKKMRPEMSKEEFSDLVNFWQDLEEKLRRLVSLPHLMEEANKGDSKARLMKMRANDTALLYGEKMRMIMHWMKGKKVGDREVLDDKNAKRLFGGVDDLEYVLNYSRRAVVHTLEQREEDIVSNKDTYGLETVIDLRDMIETEMRYEICPKNGKKRKIKNIAKLMKYVYSGKRTEREAAYRALFKQHKLHVDKLFLVYQAAVKNWGYETKLRGYASPISMRNFANQVPDEAVESLLKVCSEKKDVFGRFFEFKAREMGVTKLSRFDLFAPRKGKRREYEFEEAKNIVLETMYGFSDRFGKGAERILDENHIDSHPRTNKRSGAFCATVGPGITPYVLLNHTGTLRDVYILAHELGHGVHSLYANKQRVSAQNANLPLAETASTLAEMILFERLLADEKDEEVKKTMLWEKINDAYATVLRQNYFIKFEIEAHKRFSKGLTVDELGEMWLEGLKEQFGKTVNVDPVFCYEWSYIPHIIHTPFYCYAYSFGELVSLSLLARYKKEGASFGKKIERVMEAGGSEDPDKVLKRVGVDMKSEKFWRQGFGVVDGWIKELARGNT